VLKSSPGSGTRVRIVDAAFVPGIRLASVGAVEMPRRRGVYAVSGYMFVLFWIYILILILTYLI
jgi:hypothetical protein